MDIRNIDHVHAFATKDGSEIRELLAHRNSCIRKQSLAEARVAPGGSTTPHFHPLTEERVQVEKKPVVNEEVRVGKRQVQDTKRISDDVRHEELRTETEGDIGKDEGLKDKTRRTA